MISEATLYILQKLYNTDDIKNISLLSRNERRLDPDGETELERIMRICRVNRFAHIKQILEHLKAFFNIEELVSSTRKTFAFSLLDKFRLPGKRPDRPEAAAGGYNTTILTLFKKMLQYVGLSYSDNTLVSMVKAISHYDFETQKQSIDKFLETVRSDSSIRKINNPAAYLRGIANNIHTA